MQGFLVGRESNRKDAERPKFEPREDGHARISVPASDGPFRCQVSCKVRQTAGELVADAPRKSFNGLVYTAKFVWPLSNKLSIESRADPSVHTSGFLLLSEPMETIWCDIAE